jgi:putative addiction module component (TIGR02574 family)
MWDIQWPWPDRAIDIANLTADERLQLIEELWDSLSSEQRDAIPLTAEQEAQLDKRLDEFERDGSVGVTSDELFGPIQKRSWTRLTYRPEAAAEVEQAFD